MLAAAPIGRPQDASPRLAAALGEAPVVAAEDTRRLRRLAAALGVRVTGRVVSYYESVEAARAPGLLADADRPGADVLLITDAGTPAISDPGYRLVAAAAEAGIRVTVLPGPVRGDRGAGRLRPAERPVLLRGVPAAQGRRCGRAGSPSCAAEPRTMVFFESPRRLAATLADLAEALGADAARGGVPRADQDARGGQARHAGRAGRVGGRPGRWARSPSWWRAPGRAARGATGAEAAAEAPRPADSRRGTDAARPRGGGGRARAADVAAQGRDRRRGHGTSAAPAATSTTRWCRHSGTGPVALG